MLQYANLQFAPIALKRMSWCLRLTEVTFQRLHAFWKNLLLSPVYLPHIFILITAEFFVAGANNRFLAHSPGRTFAVTCVLE